MSNSVRIISVSYAWEMPRARDVADYDVSVGFGVSDCKLSNYSTPNKRKAWKISDERYSFPLNLPRSKGTTALTDVSGTLGILCSLCDDENRTKAAAFERFVADIIMFLLTKINYIESTPTIILLQGPTLPKLRGRLLYRRISSDIPIICLTYQREWLDRLEDRRRIPDIISCQGQNGKNVGASVVPHAPTGLDASTRSWICMKNAVPYHAEVIANTWDPSSPTGKEWISERARDIGMLLDSADIAEVLDQMEEALPLPLSVALSGAREQVAVEDRIRGFYRELCRIRKKEKSNFLDAVEEIKRYVGPEPYLKDLAASTPSSADSSADLPKFADMRRRLIEKMSSIETLLDKFSSDHKG